MSLVRVSVVVVVLAFLIGAHGVSPIAASPSATTIRDWLVPESAQAGASDRDTSSSSGIDVFGNEIDEAVGDYRVDMRGDLYERHSPDTEVPKLPPPIG